MANGFFPLPIPFPRILPVEDDEEEECCASARVPMFLGPSTRPTPFLLLLLLVLVLVVLRVLPCRAVMNSYVVNDDVFRSLAPGKVSIAVRRML